MRILILEDEDIVAQRLIRLSTDILDNPSARIKHFSDIDDANDYLASNTIDLLILDLNLHGRDGFSLLKASVSGSFHTIVVSAYFERAIEAFEYGVLDFVAKPFTKERLQKAFDRFTTGKREESTHTRYISIKISNEIKVIPLEEVEYFKACDCYSEVYLTNGDIHLHDKPLNQLEVILPPSFERVHRSYISRMNRISLIKQSPGPNFELILECGFHVPVSRSRAKAIKQQLL